MDLRALFLLAVCFISHRKGLVFATGVFAGDALEKRYVSSAIVKAWYLRQRACAATIQPEERFISHRHGFVMSTSRCPASGRCSLRFISHRHGFVMSTLRHSAIQQSINRFISHRHGFVMSTPGSTPFKKGADNGSSAIDTAL